MPALEPYLIEPIWAQFQDLLPEREADHPLGCHRPRVPDRVVFEKLIEGLAHRGPRLRLRLLAHSRRDVFGYHYKAQA